VASSGRCTCRGREELPLHGQFGGSSGCEESHLKPEPSIDAVISFYETHPINEDGILARLCAEGIALEGLTEATPQNYDQDHFGGLEAVDVLAAKAGINSAMRVLDVCSGLGGPARYLAHRLGCRITRVGIRQNPPTGGVSLPRR